MKKREWIAIHSMLDVALHQHKGVVTLVELSQRQKISQSYLEQIFKQLRTHELVRSVHGRRGGYLLNGNLSSISVLKIIHAVSQNSLPTFENDPSDIAIPPMQPIWKNLHLYINHFLSVTTLKHLVDQAQCPHCLSMENV